MSTLDHEKHFKEKKDKSSVVKAFKQPKKQIFDPHKLINKGIEEFMFLLVLHQELCGIQNL